MVSRDRSGSEYYGLYLQDAQGGALRPIRVEKKVKTNLQWIDGDGKTLYYTANKTKPADYHVYRYYIAEDRHELILEGRLLVHR